ncbi:MAG TPA: anthranilate synthase component I, partial [Rhodospirillum rubrum]|nr:anthranilate synthase component I [Rhodospirillum rubrum]
LEGLRREGDRLVLRVKAMAPRFPEEERSRQPSLMSVVRALAGLFAAENDPFFGLVGAFGYDLGLAFERLPHARPRSADHRDLVLYLPDRLLIDDPEAGGLAERLYDITAADGASTAGLARETAAYTADHPAGGVPIEDDMPPGAYGAIVRGLKEAFAAGDLFEAVPSRALRRPCAEAPSRLYRRLRAANPAPYLFLANLGAGEHLIGASPEMFVRVGGAPGARRVETCPISGTIARGPDALGDAEAIRTLLNSTKDEAELTMCTDVDRNDKARVCVAGSVTVIGRRQIELYSRLIHTVDHVEGRLRPELDALDAFLSHCWAVTVTGAPKRAAMAAVEAVERAPRAWYGGAIGRLGFDGTLDTGLVLRTIRLRHGVAEVRVGATLLHRSDPEEEEAETLLKASALLALLDATTPAKPNAPHLPLRGRAPRVLVIDHEDSFVHTLASYLRNAGAETTVLRWDVPAAVRAGVEADLLVLSPGPGTPSRFALGASLDWAVARGLPVFGVCLGLQGIVEQAGGRLARLAVPAHGMASTLRLVAPGDPLFAGLPTTMRVGRYHSLHAERASLPDSLEILAESDDGVIMALRHRLLPFSAVQFHPESLMTLDGGAGPRLIANLLETLSVPRTRHAA